MDRDLQLSLVVQARKRAEQGDAAIAAQLAIIRELERQGADTTIIRGELSTLIVARDAEMATMVRLLDEMDESPPEELISWSPSWADETEKSAGPGLQPPP
jgi:hypothetical protein